jgi:hypothetical protein
LPQEIGFEFAVCSSGKSNLYVTGGSMSIFTTYHYHTHQNTWNKLADMNIGRRGHVMAAVGDSLYVLGGYKQVAGEEEECHASIEQMWCGSWTIVGELSVAVNTTSVAVSADNIFVFGGITENNADIATVQCFNTRDRIVTRICDLPSPQGFTRSVAHHDTVLTVTTDGDILELHQQDGEPTTCLKIGQIDTFNRCDYGFTKDRDQSLIVLGGTCASDVFGDAPDTLLDDMIWIDPATGEIKDRKQMPFSVSDFGCCQVSIHKRFLVKHI